MLFSRKSIGISISMTGIETALLGGKRSLPLLERVSNRTFDEGVFRTALKEPNIVDPERFSRTLLEAINLTIFKGKNISLSLPDATGRVMLMDVENRFKSKAEGLDIIRWKLKKNIPFDFSDSHLDYQMLQVKQSGEMSLIVALVSKAVISQYEDVITATGFNPNRIELESFSLCRGFGRQLDVMGDGALIYIYNNTIGIMVFNDGLPVFTRFKTIPESRSPHGRIRGEIANSLLAYRERFPEVTLQKLSCFISPDVSADFCELLEEVSGVKPIPLDIASSVKLSADPPTGQTGLFRYAAAIGAAIRGL